MVGPDPRSPQDTHACVIGAGGIGSALLPRLVRMPFVEITIVDGDRVEEKNLDKQELYAPVDVGHPKAAVAAAWLRNAPISPWIGHHDVFIDANNVEAIIARHDVVFDCTDDPHVRHLIDGTCKDLCVPLVSGAVHALQAQVIVLHVPGEGDGIMLADLFPGRSGAEQDGCDMRDVPLSVLDATAQRMAWCARTILQRGMLMNGRIDVYDGRTRTWMEIAPPQHRPS